MFSLSRNFIPLACDGCLKESKSLPRHLSVLSIVEKLANKKKNLPRLVDTNKHKQIYEFRFVRISAAFLRVKNFVPAITIIAVPILYVYEQSIATVVAFAISGAVQYGMLALASKGLDNVVGAVFINKSGDPDEIVFANIDKSGRRVDNIHKIKDVVVLAFPTKLHEMTGFTTVAVRGSDVCYKINIKSPLLKDVKACKQLFGNIWRDSKT